MNFKSNLDFTEVFMRYMLLMLVVIIAGVTLQYWLVIPAMIIFLTAILGWCPIKQWITNSKTKKHPKTNHGDHRKMAA